MSGIRGFSIVTVATLLLAFLFIGIGRGETQEEFLNKYNESIIKKIDQSISVITRVDIEGEEYRRFENLNNPWFLCNAIDNGDFDLFFSFDELSSEKLKIKQITANEVLPIPFFQKDKAFKHRKENKSLVAFELVPELTKKGRNILVTVEYEPNEQKIIRKEFVIYSRQIDLMFDTIEDWYKEYLNNPRLRM